MSKKAIGQFFSGALVSDLLVCAANLDDVGSLTAIDPMVGKADMLNALERIGADPNRLFGIDIDGEAISNALTDVPACNLLTADAFSNEAVSLYRSREWDLVITNPPYVRYQKLGAIYGVDPVNNLRRLLESAIEALADNGSKRLYLDVAKKYSGLADLAVPCWILCAYLVRPGGKLAMVLPDSWFKREYSSAVREILEADFTVDRIIVDESRAWFVDAQVKTSLLIATKNKHKSERSSSAAARHVGLTKHAASPDSLVGSLVYGQMSGMDAFRGLCVENIQYKSDMVWAKNNCPFAREAQDLAVDGNTATLQEWGIKVGQGLRTGANGFFYFLLDDNGRASNDIWKELAGNEPVDPSTLPLVPVLRYQDEIGSKYSIDTKGANHLLLYVSAPIDVGDNLADGADHAGLARYIGYCESHDVIQNSRSLRIPNLSAVKTNGPTSEVRGCKRYWYMLPELKDRHRPDLVVPRINGGIVRTYLLPEARDVVVDANFSTLWIESEDRSDAYIALALLNSTYVRLELEKACNVLGGGALKCEAASIRKVRLPVPSVDLKRDLLDLGLRLAKSEGISCADEIQDSIDRAIAQTATTAECIDDLVVSWKTELNARLGIRKE